MEAVLSKRYTSVRKHSRRSKAQRVRMSIIFGFIFITTSISVLLPVYIALMPLGGS